MTILFWIFYVITYLPRCLFLVLQSLCCNLKDTLTRPYKRDCDDRIEYDLKVGIKVLSEDNQTKLFLEYRKTHLDPKNFSYIERMHNKRLLDKYSKHWGWDEDSQQFFKLKPDKTNTKYFTINPYHNIDE